MDLNNIKNFIKKKLYKIFDRIDLVENINLDLTRSQKRVLISYLNSSFKEDLISNHVFSTNILEVNQIIKVFIDLDFAIDVVDCLDHNGFEKVKDKSYDVLFGLGFVFNSMIELPNFSKRILYMTEHHPSFSKEKELERINYFFERHGKNVSILRSGIYYQEKNFDSVDDVIVLGETDLFYNKNYKVHSLKPTGLRNDKYYFNKREFDTSKKNFLWFGSYGAIHKGLDLLIDIFTNRKDLNLFICGLSDSEMNLFNFSNKANIFNLGKINVQSELYLELVNKCSFVIIPSCSEGMSTSILTCMRHSMIPIVMKNTGFNYLHDMVFLLEDYKINYIEKQINHITSLNDEHINSLHEKIYSYANDNFNLLRFTGNFKSIITEIINQTD
ncbi:glycosyltransferase family 1 protein [Cyclobacteriaceae bacterium YHN15]|nr:glycosyltransferase family 1 protein [Cyclobacteriaceae bacterium YHN15]